MNRNFALLVICIFTVAALAPIPAFASVEGSLEAVQNALLGMVLPAFATIGIGFAAYQFFMGSPNAKQHLMYAVGGTIILYSAQSIVRLISSIVK